MILINSSQPRHNAFSTPEMDRGPGKSTDLNCYKLVGKGTRDSRSRALRADAYDDVDAADFGAGGRHRQAGYRQILAGDVLQLAGHFAKEVVVVGSVGVEIRP